MDPKMFQALGGGMPAQAPQQPAPAPAGSPAPGAGLSLFNGLAPQQAPQGAQPLTLGSLIASNKPVPIINAQGKQDAMDQAFGQAPHHMDEAGPAVRENQAGLKRADAKIQAYAGSLEGLRAQHPELFKDR